jgi:hypothetical protein
MGENIRMNVERCGMGSSGSSGGILQMNLSNFNMLGFRDWVSVRVQTRIVQRVLV